MIDLRSSSMEAAGACSFAVVPALSIVVPTRNRHHTLRVIVDKFLSWDSQDFELVVEDNSDDPAGFVDVLARHADDSRLRYAHFPGRRSMVENCEAAVARCRGSVLTLIGDDDAVVVQSIEAARWMVEQGIDALVCCKAGYTWPDMEHAVAINRGYNGKLVMPPARGVVKRIDVPRELDALAKAGAQRLGQLPCLYQAFVRRSVIERLVAQLGRCFPGPVPDMSSAVSMALHLGTSFFTDVPLVVSGQSRSSMSGQNSVRKHQGDIRNEKSLPDNAADQWDPRIPRYWSAPTIWAETALKAAAMTGDSGFERRFSFARVYANCLAFNDRVYGPLVMDAMRHGGVLRALSLAPRVLWFLVVITGKRAINLARKFVVGFPGEAFEDVAQATGAVEAVIAREGLVRKMMQGHQRGRVGS
jgi:hypothetical protein